MVEERDSPEDLFKFAQALVRKLKRRRQLNWDEHRMEDAAQDLFLAGWQVWQDEGDLGLAKNRMVARISNLFRDYRSQRRHEPKSQSDLLTSPSIDQSGNLWSEDAVCAWDTPSRHERAQGDPAEIARLNDYLASLPPRRRKVIGLRMAGYSNAEIADELSIGLRTVERELEALRKEHKNAKAD